MEDSLVGHSQANGLAEGAVKEPEGVIRSLRSAVELFNGVVLDSAGLVVPWLVRRPSSMISRSLRGWDGQTQGKPYRKWLPPFAETVVYLKVGIPRSRLEDRLMEGLISYMQCRSVLTKL